MRIRRYLPFIGIGIFLYLLFKIGLKSLWFSLLNADTFYLLASILVLFIVIVFQTLKWFYLARKQGIKIGFRDALRINILTGFYGLVTPSKIGSALRANYLQPYAKNIGKGINNFVVDKLLDIASLAVLSLFFVVLFNEVFSFISRWMLIVVFIIVLMMLVVLRSKEVTRGFLRIFYKKLIPRKWKKGAKEAFESFYENMPRKRDFVVAFVLNILNWVVVYLSAYFVALAVGMSLPFFYFLAILPIGTLITLIPITINGLGTREATLIGLFGLFGVASEKVFLMSILTIFINGLFFGILSLFVKNKIKQ